MSRGDRRIEISRGNRRIEISRGNRRIEISRGNRRIEIRQLFPTQFLNGNVAFYDVVFCHCVPFNMLECIENQ